jgi:dihydrodipicolinate synthase/N-acetylneuraminate lyase
MRAYDMAGLAGVLAVFQTPFDDHGRIDHPTMEKLFEWLFANGADGVVFAMVSEILRLSSEERDEVATMACRLSRGHGACVISVGAESLTTALRHARHAEDAGADAVMATSTSRWWSRMRVGTSAPRCPSRCRPGCIASWATG